MLDLRLDILCGYTVNVADIVCCKIIGITI